MNFEIWSKQFSQDPDIFPTDSAEKNRDIFCHFVKQNNIDMIKRLESKIEDVDFRDNNGTYPICTPLGYAVQDAYCEIAEILLKRKANPGACRLDDCSFFYDKRLQHLDHGIDDVFNDPRKPIFQNPLLLFAINNMHQELALLLIQYGANVSEENDWGESPLKIACDHNQIQVVEALIKAGADVNKPFSCDHIKNKQFCRHLWPGLLHRACFNHIEYEGNLELITLLLESGASPHIIDCRNQTPLFASTGYPDLNEVFLQYGSRINHQDFHNDSVLHEAVRYGWNNSVGVFLRNGIDIHLVNNEGDTAVDIAIQQRNSEALKLMIQHRDINFDELDLDAEDRKFVKLCKT